MAFSFAGCKRARTEDDSNNPESPSSPSREDLQVLRSDLNLPYGDLQPLSLKIRSSTPPPAESRPSPGVSPPPDEPQKGKGTQEKEEGHANSPSGSPHEGRAAPVPIETPQKSSSSGSRGDPSGALDTLVRLFPGRRTQLLEAVLSRCDGDTLKAIQTLLNASPSIFSTHDSSAGGGLDGCLEAVHNNHSSTPTTPTFSLNGRQTPTSTPTRSPIIEPPHPLASPFSTLPPPTLGRFSYPHPHPFMGLPYPPFLHPRPEYYPPLNLAAHGVGASLHTLSHHNSPSPLREGSLSPSSPTDQDTE